MIKANQQLLAASSNFLLNFFLIFMLIFTYHYSYTLDKKPTKDLSDIARNIKNIQKYLALTAKTLRLVTSESTSPETIRIVKILELLSPLSPQRFCHALDLIIPPMIGKILIWCVVTHRHKCLYDHMIAEHRAKSSHSKERIVASHVVNKFDGSGARVSKAPDNFSELSRSFKDLGASIRSSWRDLKLIQSAKPTSEKLLPTAKTVIGPTISGTYCRPRSPDLVKAEPKAIALEPPAPARVLPIEFLAVPVRFPTPPPTKILPTRTPPTIASSTAHTFIFGPNSTTTDNLNLLKRPLVRAQVDQHAQAFNLSHSKHKSKTDLLSDSSPPIKSIDPSLIALIYPQLADRQTSSLDLAIDKFTGTTPSAKSPFAMLARPEVLHQK